MAIHLVSIAAPYRYGIEDITRPPSAILYVGGYLRRHGYVVKIHHICENQIPAKVEEICSDNNLQYVGFSVMTGAQISSSAEMSSMLKTRDTHITILWGGIHPSIMPYETLSFPFVDFIIIGEGEISALEFSNYWLSSDFLNKDITKIYGLGYKNKGIKINLPRPYHKNLDDFWQDCSLVNIHQYIRDGDCFCFITSRGCPHECGFCYNQAFNHRRWRAHSVDFVVEEMLNIKKLTGIKRVTFDDDNFFTNRERGLEIIRKLREIDITCEWVELRCDYITENLVNQMVDLGVKSIFMGWESGNLKTLQKISKGYSPELILEKTKILAKFNQLMVDASAIIAFPWESKEDIKQTFDLALRMFQIKPFMLSFNIGVYVPYPGSPIIQEAQQMGFRFPQKPQDWKKFDILSGEMELPWISKDQIKKYTIMDRYLKLLFVPKRAKRTYLLIFRWLIAIKSYLRLKLGIFLFPFELWLIEIFLRYDLKKQKKVKNQLS